MKCVQEQGCRPVFASLIISLSRAMAYGSVSFSGQASGACVREIVCMHSALCVLAREHECECEEMNNGNKNQKEKNRTKG